MANCVIGDITTTSKNDGSFILEGDTITSLIPQTLKVKYSFNLVVWKHKINIFVNQPIQTLILTMYNSRGSKIFSRSFVKLSAGNHTIPLVNSSLTSGVYFIQLNSNGEISQNIKVPLVKDRINFFFQTPPLSLNPSSSLGLSQKRTYETIDTIVVTSPGFKHNRIKITSYIGEGVACVLADSKPWKPINDLEYDKSMVKIYAKDYNFEMGQPNPNIISIGGSIRELPMHTVNFTYNFWIDTVEVSQLKFDELMKESYSNYEQPEWNEMCGLGDNYPCYLVSEHDAMLYCNARSKKDGYDTVYSYTSIKGSPGKLCKLEGEKTDMDKNGYRLPTEAEWEYACRAGSANDYYWGKDYNPYPVSTADTAEISSYSTWSANSSNIDTLYGNHPVGNRKPNAYGLYDMSGNVSEYCNDFDELYPNEYEVTDPFGASTGFARILRGGNWSSEAPYLRCANRYFMACDYLYFFTGFRTTRVDK